MSKNEEKWVYLDQHGRPTKDPTVIEMSRRGVIVKVIDRCDDRYRWRLHIDSHTNPPVRQGEGSHLSSLKSVEEAREEAILLVSSQEEEIVRSLVDPFGDDEHVAAVREQAFRRGAERGVHLVSEEMKKQADELKARSNSLLSLAEEFKSKASVLCWYANDPYAEKKE